MARHRPRTTIDRPLVLLVDGHADTREMYATALPFFGFKILTVDDGSQAFGRASQQHPDAIVTELAVATVDGWSLLDDLKHDARTRDIPVVVLTSHAESSVRERSALQGCDAFLVKPCLPEDLARTLRALLPERPTTGDESVH
jgi:two-component system, cell cycle response regulator DivK